MNENHQLCAQCGGACCKWLSGCMMPDDVFRLFPAPTLREALTQCFQSGTYVVDWWEGDPRNLDYDDPEHLGAAYYVRPRTDEDKRRLYNAGWGGRCVLLGERGCQLPAEQRPYQCRMLEPRPDQECIMHEAGSKHAISVAWIPYQSDIEEAARSIE